MEPFGLLDFLKPLLAITQNFSPNADATPTVESPRTQAPDSAQSPSLPDEQEETSSSSQNAFLSFLETHENRAKRFKR